MVLGKLEMSLCYYPGDQCFTPAYNRFWLHYSTIMFAHRDVRYLYPGDYISFDCVPDQSAVPRWCGGAMCLKGLSGGSHLHVECHGFKFLWYRKYSCRNCSYWQVVNGVHLKWLPNTLWSTGCGVIFLYQCILFYYRNNAYNGQWIGIYQVLSADQGSVIKYPSAYPSDVRSKEIKESTTAIISTWTRTYKKENEKIDFFRH